MKIIVGLGNPGSDYEFTRHNIGFGLLDFICSRKGYSIDSKKFDALYTEINICGEKVLLIKPLTYMNLSGNAVRKFVEYFKLSKDDILIIQDDLDMVLGKIKFVYNSSSGGHNGIRSIEDNLKSKEYLRLKIGISNNKSIDTRDYVLNRFSREEQIVLNDTYTKLIDLFEDFVKLDKSELMSKYNNK